VIITVSELPGSSSARVKRTPQQSYDFQNGEHPVGHAESRHVFGSSEAGDVRKELDAVSRKELSVATGARSAPSQLSGSGLPFGSVRNSRSAPKAVEFAAIALRWSAFPRRFEMQRRLSLFRQLQTQFVARLGLTVQCLRNYCGSPHFTQKQNLHLKVPGLSLHLQKVTESDLA